MASILETIKNAGKNNNDVAFPLKSELFVVPMKLADRKAIELVELLTEDPEMDGATIADLHEVFDFAKFWIEFLQLLDYQDPAKRETLRKSMMSGRNRLD